MSSGVPKIAVIGAGISGLSQSYYLQKMMKQKCNIKIFEGQNHPSGAISTQNKEGFFFEEGPRSIRNGNTVFEVLKICEEINILDKIIPSESYDNAYVYYEDKLRQLPRKMAFGPLLKFIQDHPRLLNQAFHIKRSRSQDIQGDCNMEQFVENKLKFAGFQFTGLSEFINTYLVNSFAKGVYRAEAADLSSELCLKKKHMKHYIHDYIDPTEFKQPKYSENLQSFYQSTLKNHGSFNFKEGAQTFPSELARYLESKTQTSIQLNTQIQSLNFKDNKIIVSNKSGEEEFDYVISTLNAPQINEILRNSKGNQQRINQLRNDLSSVKQLPMVSVNLGYKKDVIPKDLYSFGYLIPSVANKHLIGVVFDSCSYPTLGPKDSSRISLMFGNKLDINAPSEDFIREGLKELGEQTGIKEKPDFINFRRWEPSFPEYGVNHFYKSLRMLETAKHIHSNFQLHGRYLFTAAIPELVLLSKCFATQITSQKQK